MRTIYKYRLEKSGENLIRMPQGALPLHVGMQDNKVYIWMEVENEQPIESRRLWLHGTGWDLADMPRRCPFIGTAQTDQSLVWHVFDGGAVNG